MKKGKNLFGIIYITPAFIIYTIFIIFAVVLTFFYSLNEWDGVGAKAFIWFENYIEMFKDKNYWFVTKNTFIVVLLTIIYQVPMGLLFAYLVYTTTKGFKFFRTIYFLPVVISNAAVAIMFMTLLNNDIGPVNYILKEIGLDFLAMNWLTNKNTVLYAVAIPQLWHYIGIPFIILLAALQSVPEDIIESARIDGANKTQAFFRIIMPIIWEVIQIVVIVCVTGTLKAFESSWIMTWGGPGYASSYLSVMMFRLVFRESSFGYGCSIAFSILVYSLLFTVVFGRLFAKEKVEY